LRTLLVAVGYSQQQYVVSHS